MFVDFLVGYIGPPNRALTTEKPQRTIVNKRHQKYTCVTIKLDHVFHFVRCVHRDFQPQDINGQFGSLVLTPHLKVSSINQLTYS
jgi:hypothetical protein